MGTEHVAPGVWLVRGGKPLPRMNVYLIEDDGGGVTMFDAGVSSMVDQLRRECEARGGLNRIVLGHGHVDHRGAAPGLGAPVYCHPDNVGDAEGDDGMGYMDMSKLPLRGKVMPLLMRHWDGGPVEVAGTVAEGDDVSGFTAIDISGHAPGHIALYRARDGVVLSSDCVYTLDPFTGIKGPPRLPHAAFNLDQEATRRAVEKLAGLDPTSVWPGHADAVTEDVKPSLLKAARAR